MGATALGGGVACYVAGTGFFAHVTLRQWWVVRFGGALVLLAAIAVLALVPPMAALAIVVLVLFTLPIAERRGSEAIASRADRRTVPAAAGRR